MSGYDVIIVGARCAGATAAIALARSGARVALVDRDTFPSDTLSSHVIFPNTVARLESLGVMERLRATHKLAPGERLVWRGWGSTIDAPFPAVGGESSAYTIRRIALDAALVAEAQAAGATTVLGNGVVEVIGAGTQEDPVRGVVLQDGEQLLAPWVMGADGRTSTIAKRLGIEKQKEKRGSVSFMLAYWRGVPTDTPWSIEMDDTLGFVYGICEDDVTAVMLMGWPDLVKGTAAEREAVYERGVRSFPAVFEPSVFDRGERITEVRIASETMLRGFYRRPTGPGWALIGDANHFKHPATAQGISDAVEQAVHVADALGGADPTLAGFEAWRDARADGHYDLSFFFGAMPKPEVGARLFAGLAEPDAAADLTGCFTRTTHPSAFLTDERMARWLG